MVTSTPTLAPWNWRIKRPHANGFIAHYLVLYSITRFIVEFYRNHEQGNLWGGPLDTSQWISLGLMAIGAWYLAKSRQTPVSVTAKR